MLSYMHSYSITAIFNCFCFHFLEDRDATSIISGAGKTCRQDLEDQLQMLAIVVNNRTVELLRKCF